MTRALALSARPPPSSSRRRTEENTVDFASTSIASNATRARAASRSMSIDPSRHRSTRRRRQARRACERLKRDVDDDECVLVHDCGPCARALGGFPGPVTKILCHRRRRRARDAASRRRRPRGVLGRNDRVRASERWGDARVFAREGVRWGDRDAGAMERRDDPSRRRSVSGTGFGFDEVWRRQRGGVSTARRADRARGMNSRGGWPGTTERGWTRGEQGLGAGIA